MFFDDTTVDPRARSAGGEVEGSFERFYCVSDLVAPHVAFSNVLVDFGTSIVFAASSFEFGQGFSVA